MVTLNYRLGLLGFLRTGLQVMVILVLLVIIILVLLVMILMLMIKAIHFNQFTMPIANVLLYLGDDVDGDDDDDDPIKQIDNN